MWQIREPVRCCYRELDGVIQARIEKSSFAVHLQVRDKGVPMWDGSPSGPGMQIYSCQTKGWRNQGCGRFPIRTKALAVQNQFSVKLARTPGQEHILDGSN